MRSSLFRNSVFLLIVLLPLWAKAGPVLEIHRDSHWQAMIRQWVVLKMTETNPTSETLTLADPELRIDLSIYDLMDQVDQLIQSRFSSSGYPLILKKTLEDANGNSAPLLHFDRWYSTLNELARKDGNLKRELDQHLYLQEYSSGGMALKENIRILELAKIHHIDRYNHWAMKPVGMETLQSLGNQKPATVTSLQDLKNSDLREAEKNLRQKRKQSLDALEKSESRDCPLNVSQVEALDANRIFKAIENLVDRQDWLARIDRRMEPKLPRLENGQPALVPSFILKYEKKLIPILKDLTWESQFTKEDDQTLLEFRRWLRKNRTTVLETLNRFNREHSTALKLDFLQRKKLPHRTEVIESYPILERIHEGREPWQEEIETILLNRRGQRVMIGRTRLGATVGRVGDLIKTAVRSENLAGLAAGGGTLFLTGGNIAAALTARSLARDIYANRKYDRQAKELLTEIPVDLIQGLLTQTAFQPGKFFNLLGLGAGYGFAQGLLTKQDPLKSAAVGAAMEGAIGLLPVKVRNPLVSGMSKNALTKNALIELFTTTGKTTIRGGVVAIWEHEDVLNGMKKGAIYGASLTGLKLLILGTRYNPLSGHDPATVEDIIQQENDYDNAMGAPGGNYQINTDTIMDTPYRTGGLLPKWIQASITLPGNVVMDADHVPFIEIVVHEAHHLSQQEQLGLIRFYVEYLWESLTVPYDQLSFEISPF